MLGSPKEIEIRIGQEFRKAEVARMRIVWRVDSLFKGTDGVRYARLVRADDGTMRKTVSVATLGLGAQYLPVA